MKLNKNEKSEEKSSEKTTSNGWCPIASRDTLEVPCQESCAWNQGDYCIVYDIRNALMEISACLNPTKGITER